MHSFDDMKGPPRFVSLILFLASSLSCYRPTLALTFSNSFGQDTPNHEYACLHADRPIDIVFSHYEEDLEVVRGKLERLQNHPFLANRACVHVYTKSGKTLSLIDAARLNETVVVKIQNRGRESGAYLQYILSNYHNLPRHAIFLQADVENVDNVLEQLNQGTEQTGFLGLGTWGKCTCDHCYPDPGKLVRIREVWALATGTLCPREFQANFRGQMLVSRKRVQRHPPSFYLSLLKSLFAAPGHALHGDLRYLDENHDFGKEMRKIVESEGAHDSLFGHVMERMWSVIFDCHREEEYNSCLD